MDIRSELEKQIAESLIKVLKSNEIPDGVAVLYYEGETYNNKYSKLKKSTFNPKNDYEYLKAIYRNVEYIGKATAYKSIGSPRQIELNVSYKTVGGGIRTFVEFHNEDKPLYKTAKCEKGIHTYTREDNIGGDNGRCTGSEWCYEHNLLVEDGHFVKEHSNKKEE